MPTTKPTRKIFLLAVVALLCSINSVNGRDFNSYLSSGDEKVMIYPNPFEDVLLIETNFTGTITYDVVLTDLRGSEAIRINDVRETSVKVNTLELPKGMYYLRIISSEGNNVILPVIKR